MKLTIFNGSPRGMKSNTKILMEHFINGLNTIKKDRDINIYYLKEIKNNDLFVKEFENSEYIIIAFPLYTDSMPGIVKYFIDKLIDVNPGKTNCKIGFVVQSGFPETAHSRYVERYLEKFSVRIGAEYLGTIKYDTSQFFIWAFVSLVFSVLNERANIVRVDFFNSYCSYDRLFSLHEFFLGG